MIDCSSRIASSVATCDRTITLVSVIVKLEMNYVRLTLIFRRMQVTQPFEGPPELTICH
jgi:hypothetical protein